MEIDSLSALSIRKRDAGRGKYELPGKITLQLSSNAKRLSQLLDFFIENNWAEELDIPAEPAGAGRVQLRIGKTVWSFKNLRDAFRGLNRKAPELRFRRALGRTPMVRLLRFGGALLSRFNICLSTRKS